MSFPYSVKTAIKTVYIASSSKFVDDCKKLEEWLFEKYEVEVTRPWWRHYFKEYEKYKAMSDQEFYSDTKVQLVPVLDFKGVDDADLVIILVKDRYKLTGALIEMGYALAKGKPVIVFGKMKRSAMAGQCIHVQGGYDELEQVLELIIHE